MNNEKIFKTKTGFCHITPDKIVLTRDGIIGNVASVTVGNTISRTLIIYGGLIIVLAYLAIDNYRKGQILQPVVLGLLSVYLVYGIVSSINNSAIPVIDRKKIKEVKVKKAIGSLTRTRFEVFFEDDQGKIKKRLILLPGSFTDGQNETDKAIRIMRDEKLITN